MTKKELIKLKAETSLKAFINLVHPQRVLGDIHHQVIDFWEREDKKKNDLVLLPRDHQKSALKGYRVAQAITKNPAIKVLYLSSTSNLAVKQLKFIKDILTSDIYRFYWPEMINPEEARREKWSETEISVDHPKRKAEYIRDPTIIAAGLTTNVIGLHCDVLVFDDVVVYDNAYTEDGRGKTATQYSLLSSVKSADAEEWVVGTRYHPKDLYGTMVEMSIDQHDEAGNVVSTEPVYDVFQRQVESLGDGTGEFLWPRQQRSDGKWFGFNREILARKRVQYLDPIQFRAQYYNDPNDPTIAGIDRSDFQYYDKSYVYTSGGVTYVNGRKLNVFASIDFAYSLSDSADYTSIAVVGVDSNRNYYVLDIDRFKTKLVSEYYEHILNLYHKWQFRTLRAEVNAAQVVIVEDLKRNYIYRDGLSLTIKEFRPNRHEGTKKERIAAIVQPRYANGQVWHYKGGHCQVLEEELLLANPPHDDVKDAVASCIELCDTAPPGKQNNNMFDPQFYLNFVNQRFGGIS